MVKRCANDWLLQSTPIRRPVCPLTGFLKHTLGIVFSPFSLAPLCLILSLTPCPLVLFINVPPTPCVCFFNPRWQLEWHLLLQEDMVPEVKEVLFPLYKEIKDSHFSLWCKNLVKSGFTMLYFTLT